MSIQVKFFASMREKVGKPEAQLDSVEAGMTTLKVWQASTGLDALDTHVLIAVNQEYVNSDHPVADGDEVAFFPPVTGG